MLGPHILFDCIVTEDPPSVDFSSYDTVFGCSEGTFPGLYVDEHDFSKGVSCLAPEDRMSSGIR